MKKIDRLNDRRWAHGFTRVRRAVRLGFQAARNKRRELACLNARGCGPTRRPVGLSAQNMRDHFEENGMHTYAQTRRRLYPGRNENDPLYRPSAEPKSLLSGTVRLAAMYAARREAAVA